MAYITYIKPSSWTLFVSPTIYSSQNTSYATNMHACKTMVWWMWREPLVNSDKYGLAVLLHGVQNYLLMRCFAMFIVATVILYWEVFKGTWRLFKSKLEYLWHTPPGGVVGGGGGTEPSTMPFKDVNDWKNESKLWKKIKYNWNEWRWTNQTGQLRKWREP